MKKSVLIVSFLTLFSAQAFSQTSFGNEPSFIDRLYFGGGMGFSVGSNVSSVTASPLVGYMITDRLSAGLGFTYQYIGFRNVDISASNYGGRVFGRFNITQELFLYNEYEYLNFEIIDLLNRDNNERQGFSSYLAGLGYAVPIGRVAALYAIGLYNFSWNENKASPYDSPWVFRAGITAGFGF